MKTKRRSLTHPIILCILDGWGHNSGATDNAITEASTPIYDRLLATSPNSLLHASEDHVGLPSGQMGNSEVGHQSIGAGRVILQDLPRINQLVSNSGLSHNATLRNTIKQLRSTRGNCHIMGLMSPGGVHSHQSHIIALAAAVAANGVPVFIHGFLDGRDSPPRQGISYLRDFLNKIHDNPGVTLATLCGRFFAMDRDNRWDRTKIAYDMLVQGIGDRTKHPLSCLKDYYANNMTDEFVSPTILGNYSGMQDTDGFIMANFRADRVRQILSALVDPDFSSFDRKHKVSFAATAGMTHYSDKLDEFIPSISPPIKIINTLGQIVANAGLKQLRIAETEKYAHVTFFLNGGDENSFPGEARIMIPSPKVTRYDMVPEMSARRLTDTLIKEIESNAHDLIVVNYANADMVGHTGNMKAAILAVSCLDECLGRLEAAVRRASGIMIITADHGNIEKMGDSINGEAHTAHTTNDVPFIVINSPMPITVSNGNLADIAPTILKLMQLHKPNEMTGRSLIEP